MNVYIYGGTSRENATNTIISGNQQPKVGQVYQVEISREVGIMVVAYPIKNSKNTKL